MGGYRDRGDRGEWIANGTLAAGRETEPGRRGTMQVQTEGRWWWKGGEVLASDRTTKVEAGDLLVRIGD